MAESCPLAGGGQAIEVLPDICRRNCAELWGSASQNEMAETDYYPQPALDDGESCDHEHHDVVFSHEALQSVDNSEKRLYSIVNRCEGCSIELFEDVWEFRCPLN